MNATLNIMCILLFLIGSVGCSEEPASIIPKDSQSSSSTESTMQTSRKSEEVYSSESSVKMDHDKVSENKKSSLNLSIDNLQLLGEGDSVGVDYSSRNSILPNVFEQSKKEKKTHVSGDVLREDENPDYVDSINGAKVSVKVKIP